MICTLRAGVPNVTFTDRSSFRLVGSGGDEYPCRIPRSCPAPECTNQLTGGKMQTEQETDLRNLGIFFGIALTIALVACMVLMSMGRSDTRHKLKHTTTTLLSTLSAMPKPANPSEEALEDRYFTVHNDVSRGTPRSTSTTRKVSVAKPTTRTNRSGNHRGYTTTRDCIAAVEHNGSYSRSNNPTHFGRYQFDRNAWIAHGGDPKDWGTASPTEQDRVFNNAMDAGAYSRWTPYDGCG